MSPARTFRCEPQAVTAARRFVRETLSDRSPQLVDAAELMTSELVTNCVRHAHTAFELVVHDQGEVRVEVSDSGAGCPRPLSPGEHDPTGRGLRIVEALSDAWGVIPRNEGKTVWFEIRSAV